MQLLRLLYSSAVMLVNSAVLRNCGYRDSPTYECCQHCCRGWRGGGQPVSAQTIRRTLHQIGLHGCHPRRKPLLKMMHKKARKQLAEEKQTKDMDYWNHVLWSGKTKINLFGSDDVKRVWRQPGEEYKYQVCLACSQAWWWECHGLGLHECCYECQHVLWHTEAVHGRRAVFQHDNDPKHTSKTTTALLKKLRVKVMDRPSMSPDLNPIEHLWGILKQKVEERKVSNIHQLRDVITEEWKRTPVATCEALVNSMPKRVKAVLENNGGHTKYWHFGPNLDIFT